MKKNQSAFFLILFVLILIAIPLTILASRQRQEIRKKASGGIANISIVPSAITKNVNISFPLHIWLNTGSQRIGYARVKLMFDKSILSLVSVQTTQTMKNVNELTNITNANSSGEIVINLGVTGPDRDLSPSGAIDFATLTFKGIKNGSSGINIDSTRSQIVQMDTQEMTINSSGGMVTIGTGGPTSTPAPTPPINTSPTPTGTPGQCIRPGDANGDGRVDGIDYARWLNHLGETTSNGCQNGDFNNDRVVDGLDYAKWRNNLD